jgi:pimeloyl-ACP methyl ester carboxylesterase
VKLVLVHGAATTGHVWRYVADALRSRSDTAGDEIIIPERPQSGDLNREVAALAELADDALVIGVSGGATLGLELSAQGVAIRGAVLHEPAAGSLAPGLLSSVGEALITDGIAGFGLALYGATWTTDETGVDLHTVQREFAMFGGFEPRALQTNPNDVLITTGETSPRKRHGVADALRHTLLVRTAVVPRVAHAVHLDAPALFAAIIAEQANRLR